MGTKFYDPTQHTIVVANIPIVKGFADGEFIKVERESDDFGDVVGTDGEVTRAALHDERATVTLTLMQSADANALLSTLRLTDKNSPGGAGVGIFLLKDRGGTTLLAGNSCWIQRSPDVTLDKTPTGRAWKIRVANLKSFVGGN